MSLTPISCFSTHPLETATIPKKFLGNYNKYLVRDGFDAYNKLMDAIRCECEAHSRRKFVDELPLDKALVEDSAATNG